jgi:hypothetical protein
MKNQGKAEKKFKIDEKTKENEKEKERKTKQPALTNERTRTHIILRRPSRTTLWKASGEGSYHLAHNEI